MQIVRDGVIGMEHDGDDIVTAAVEVKTMTSVNTIKNARQLRQRFHSFVRLQNVGRNRVSTKQFQALVPSPEYRAQCLHHSVTLNTPNVLYVVRKAVPTALVRFYMSSS